MIFCQFGMGVVDSLSGSKIQEVEKAAKEGQAVEKTEIEKLLADKKGWKLDETDPSDLKVHPSEDAVGDEDLALPVKLSGCQ